MRNKGIIFYLLQVEKRTLSRFFFSFFNWICNHTSYYNSLRTSATCFLFYELFLLRNIETCTISLVPSFVCSKDEVNYPRRHSPFTLAIRPSKGCLSYLFVTFFFFYSKANTPPPSYLFSARNYRMTD